MRLRVWLVPIALAYLGCDSFGSTPIDDDTSGDAAIETDALPIEDSGGSDASDATAEAEAPECRDDGTPAVEMCEGQDFCDHFEQGGTQPGAGWNGGGDLHDDGKIEYGTGRTGAGFVSKVINGAESRARLLHTPVGAGVALSVHVDFDVRTREPAFSDPQGFVDIVKFLPKQGVENEATGLEWANEGFRAYVGGTILRGVPFPVACAWVHVHVAVLLKSDATGSIAVTINGRSVLSLTNVKTAKEPATAPTVAVGGWARGTTSPDEIAYDNVSIYMDP